MRGNTSSPGWDCERSCGTNLRSAVYPQPSVHFESLRARTSAPDQSQCSLHLRNLRDARIHKAIICFPSFHSPSQEQRRSGWEEIHRGEIRVKRGRRFVSRTPQFTTTQSDFVLFNRKILSAWQHQPQVHRNTKRSECMLLTKECPKRSANTSVPVLQPVSFS